MRVLLDTNVVQHLTAFGEYIYDGYLSSERLQRFDRLGENLKSDIESLRIILGVAPTRSPAIPVVSELSILELAATIDPVNRSKLVSWGLELATYDSPTRPYRLNASKQRRLAVASNLPDTVDQLLLGECRRLECEAFVTTDYRTILSRRTGQRIDGVLVLSPTEWWERLQPWWALWV
ncbi:MAG: hypothetical protein ACRD22_22790 [Terriglobia bacterium]